MTEKNICFLFIFIVLLPVCSVYSLSSNDATVVIQEIKESFKQANEKIAQTAQQALQNDKDYFSQANKSEKEKVELVFSIFTDCNTVGLKVAYQYIARSEKIRGIITKISPEETQTFLATITTISTQTKLSLKLKTPLSDELSVYIEQIKNILNTNTKEVVQAIFNYLQQSCPELDSNILSD